MATFWPPEDIARLMDMAQDPSLIPRQIAIILSKGTVRQYTRNAVIGQLNRLGLRTIKSGKPGPPTTNILSHARTKAATWAYRTPWPQDLNDQLVALYKTTHLSASIMAQRLTTAKRPITACAVYGKIRSLGLAESMRPKFDHQRPYVRTHVHKVPSREDLEFQYPTISQIRTVPASYHAVVSRKRNECAYPSGEGEDITFCCAPVFKGSYCQPHHALTTAPKSNKPATPQFFGQRNATGTP
jgi:hypothetical protein